MGCLADLNQTGDNCEVDILVVVILIGSDLLD